MVVLKLIAIAIFAGSLLAFIVQCAKGRSRATLLYLASAILGVALLFLTSFVQKKLDASIATLNTVASAVDAAENTNGENMNFAEEDSNANTNEVAADAADSGFNFDDSEGGEVAAEGGEAVADGGEAVADDGEAVADGGEVVAEGGEAVADGGEVAAEGGEAVAEAGEAVAEAGEAVAEAGEVAAEAGEAAAENVVAEAPAEPAPEAVENDPLAPTAIAGNDIEDAKVKEKISFDGKKSKKNKAKIKEYHWDFGDGSSADSAQATHAYETAGSYTATLTIVDADGHKAQAVRKIEVNRPDGKIKFATNKVPDVISSKAAPADVTGSYKKEFSGSKLFVEVAADVEADIRCVCGISASISGPNCEVVQKKEVKDGDSSRLTAKVNCVGEVGSEYAWSIKRENPNACECTFTDVKITGYEN